MKYQNEFLTKVLFTTQDVKELYNSIATKYSSLSSYVQNGKLARIRRDLYGAIDRMTNEIYATKYEIATKIVDGGYLVYHSALEFYGLHSQVFNTMYVATDKRFTPFDYNGVDYQRIVSQFRNGVVNKMQNTIVRVTDIERTIIDCINRIDLAGGLEELISAINSIAYLDESKLITYLDLYTTKLMYKKAGFLFSKIRGTELSDKFYVHCKERIGNGRSYLNENRKKKGKLNIEWNLIVPTDLFADEEVKND